MLTAMKIKGKLYIENLDIQMYKGIADLAENKIQKIDEELIPSFIIDEALAYFCKSESYEICQNIKVFFTTNLKYTIKTSRAEWFGISCCR